MKIVRHFIIPKKTGKHNTYSNILSTKNRQAKGSKSEQDIEEEKTGRPYILRLPGFLTGKAGKRRFFADFSSTS